MKDTSSRQRVLEILKDDSPTIYTYLWCSSRHVTFLETHRRKDKLYLSVLFNDVGNCWIIVVSVMDEGRSVNIGGMMLMRRNRSSRRETSPSATLFTNPIWTGLGLSRVSALRGSANNCQSLVTACYLSVYSFPSLHLCTPCSVCCISYKFYTDWSVKMWQCFSRLHERSGNKWSSYWGDNKHND